MLETTIAVAVLGVGLIMVAAVFPVALTQHQNSAEQASALELLTKAEALLWARLDTTRLYVPAPPTLPAGTDSPWYLLPTVNIVAGANNLAPGASNWDAVPQPIPSQPGVNNLYANLINGFSSVSSVPEGNFFDFIPQSWVAATPTSPRQAFSFGLDILSSRAAPFSTNNQLSPFSDTELQDAPNHYVWYGFYRRLANGDVKYAVAVCKQRRGQLFAEQDMSSINTSLAPQAQTPFASPQPLGPTRRIPVPWRVSVVAGLSLAPGGERLGNRLLPPFPLLGGGSGLGSLAPVGSKLMIQGTSTTTAAVPPSVPAGQILTVSEVAGDSQVNIVGEVEYLPGFGSTPPGYWSTFDVWVFPPAIEGGTFGKESPVLAWRTNL